MASYPRPNNRLSTTIFTPQNWNVQPDPLGGGGDTATVSRPGGPPNSVQFNQAGALGGSSQLLFSNNTLQALQLNVINSLNVKSGTLSVGDRVGIKKSSPGFDLDVDGSINFTGTLYQDGTPFTSGTTLTPESDIVIRDLTAVGVECDYLTATGEITGTLATSADHELRLLDGSHRERAHHLSERIAEFPRYHQIPAG